MDVSFLTRFTRSLHEHYTRIFNLAYIWNDVCDTNQLFKIMSNDQNNVGVNKIYLNFNGLHFKEYAC